MALKLTKSGTDGASFSIAAAFQYEMSAGRVDPAVLLSRVMQALHVRGVLTDADVVRLLGDGWETVS